MSGSGATAGSKLAAMHRVDRAVDEPVSGEAGNGSSDNGDFPPPPAPTTFEETGLDINVLLDLALKHAYHIPRFSTQWAAEKLCLPLPLVAELLEQLRAANLLEVIGHLGLMNHLFAISGRGRDQAARLTEICGYIGPAPVSIDNYTRSLHRQLVHLPRPAADQIRTAVSEMVLSEDTVRVAGIAARSGRSLFLHGPPGNGKTTLSRLLYKALQGTLWIPRCIALDEDVIRVYDPHCHEAAPHVSEVDLRQKADRRWVRIRRPFVMVGGELNIDSLDLIFDERSRYYEAPLHLKANGGVFVLDDFGCQRVPPDDLLNRWIHPLEHGVDYLTLRTGQQIEFPFQQMLIVSTNREPTEVMSPAFLRRMGYRLRLGDPSAEQYAEILRRYAAASGLEITDAASRYLLDRYEAEGRPRHGCEPRDLIHCAIDACDYQQTACKLNEASLDIAWRSYFGQPGTMQDVETSQANGLDATATSA